MKFDFKQLKMICRATGLQHQELAALLKITRPTFYLWAKGGKPQTPASYDLALKVLRALKRGLAAGDFPIPEGMNHDDRVREVAERYARNYVAE